MNAVPSRLLPLALLAILGTACSMREYPTPQGPRQLFANDDAFDEDAIAQALATSVQLPPRPRIAVVLLDGDAVADPLDIAARAQALEELRTQLDRRRSPA